MDNLVLIEVLPLSEATSLTPTVKKGVLHIPIREGSTFFSRDYKIKNETKRVGKKTIVETVRIFDREKFFNSVGNDKFDETRRFINKKKVEAIKIYTSSNLNAFNSAYALASRIVKNAKIVTWKDEIFETELDLFLFLKHKPWAIRRRILSEIKKDTELFLNYEKVLPREGVR